MERCNPGICIHFFERCRNLPDVIQVRIYDSVYHNPGVRRDREHEESNQRFDLSKPALKLICLEHVLDIGIVVIDDPTNFGIRQSTINTKVLERSRRDGKNFSDFVGFEPFLYRLAGILFEKFFETFE